MIFMGTYLLRLVHFGKNISLQATYFYSNRLREIVVCSTTPKAKDRRKQLCGALYPGISQAVRGHYPNRNLTTACKTRQVLLFYICELNPFLNFKIKVLPFSFHNPKDNFAHIWVCHLTVSNQSFSLPGKIFAYLNQYNFNHTLW